MANLNAANATTTDLSNSVSDYTVTTQVTDAGSQKENKWENPNATKYLGFYKSIPELKKSIDALALWAVGKGYDADPETTLILEHMNGWGEDTFESICMNLIICKKIFGDAYAEIVRDADTDTLLNLKVLDPAKMTHVTNDKGILIRYEYRTGNKVAEFEPEKILHLSNDRIADEIHGTSVIEACEWVILARNEAMTDFRKILHRNMHFRYMEVDFDDTATLNSIKNQYADAVKNGELLLLPKGTAEMKTVNPSIIDPQSWIRYLENFFYNAVGIPKVVLGGSEEFTESSAKVGYLTFEQVYSREQNDLQQDLWNQVAIEVTFFKPASLKNEMITSNQKNTGQLTAAQPHEMTADMSGEGL
jgi:hypothetical protein